MNKIKLIVFNVCVKFFYPKIDLSSFSALHILKTAFFQKVIGFNRDVYWPVHRSTTVKNVDNITRGTRLPGLSKNCHLDGRNGIIFGSNVRIGPNVTIVSMNHNILNYDKYEESTPIVIGNNCWIAANVTILPGVEIGEHTIVAAGTVVTKSFRRKNQIIAGVPAKIIKKIDDYKVENVSKSI